MKYYIYIDDIRENDRWYNEHLDGDIWRVYICKSYNQAIETINQISCMELNPEIIIDLDHDLGEGNENDLELSGYEICKWIVQNRVPLFGFHIHSMNPVGANNMRQLLTRYGYRELG